MKYIVALISLFLSTKGITQSTDINFIKGVNWEKIKETAKINSKYIFVDCYATWCGPCKLMEQTVFQNPKVSNFINDHFISLKIQMDSTNNDDNNINLLRSVAIEFGIEYNIKSLPTILYFSPQGVILDKNIGTMDDTTFLRFSASILEDVPHYYEIVAKLNKQVIDSSELLYLIQNSLLKQDNDIFNKSGRYFINKYLSTISNVINCDTNLIITIAPYLANIINSNDRIFRFLVDNSQHVDSLLRIPKYTENVINRVITIEELSYLQHKSNNDRIPPKWDSLSKRINAKFGNYYGSEAILMAKINWYKRNKDWQELSKFTIEKMEKYGLDTTGPGKYFINNDIYNVVFLHSTDRSDLYKAAEIMHTILNEIPKDGECTDTYANLLYKLGKTSKALYWESKALREDPNNQDIKNDLLKMHEGLPTWQ
jgi:thioredoxin-related protein